MKHRSRILESVHDAAKDLHDAGVMDARTMREFDALCIEPAKPLSKSAIKKIRLSQNVSQPIFAAYLNVSPSAVKQWESGEKKPSGAALRLLHLIETHGLDILIGVSYTPRT
jgi:putative transcriptional regulator